MIISNAHRTFTVRRKTAFVLDPVASSVSMSLDRQPVRESVLQVRASAGAGTITITGTDSNGDPITDALTFTSGGFRQSVKRFVTVEPNGIVVAWSGGLPTIEIKSLGADGSLQNQDYPVVSGWPMYMDRSRPSRAIWKGERSGSAEEEPVFILIQWSETWAPREGDILVDDHSNEQFVITGSPLLEGYNRVSHWEAWGMRREGSL